MCYYPNLPRANAWQTSSDFTLSYKAGDQGIQSTAQFFSSETRYDCSSENANWLESISSFTSIMILTNFT